MSRVRITLALGAIVAALATSPSAQNQGQGLPTFRGGANLVRVDLYATRDGRNVEDLAVGELDVLEDGVKQTIESFEHVVVRPPVAQELRAEPNTVPESRQMAADPRARIFVIFLDTYHTGFGNAARMRSPLLKFIDRVVGQDDLVALMTPEMSAADVTLGRRTTVISKLLDENTWGRRGRIADDDPIETLYDSCYMADDKTIPAEMKARRREKLSLDALDDLIVHLGGLREERKAVLAVSEGWLQYGPNPNLARLLKRDEGRIPEPPGIVDRGARERGGGAINEGRQRCEADRMALAHMDHTLRLQQMTERANRVNVTFYPVGAQGLAVFDSDIGPDPPPTLQQDAASLRARQNGLRLLGEQTDGVAIVNTNNVDGLLRRVVDDLSSYYLLGYTSSNSKLDGRYRTIKVRVTRPNVQVRARPGYRALTPAELPAQPASPSPTSALTPASAGVLAALNAMSFNPRAELRTRASSWSQPAGAPGGPGAFWLVGSLDDATRRDSAWAAGGTADLAVRASDGTVVLSKTVPIGAADGGFALQVPETGGLAPGEYAVRVRAKSAGSGGVSLDDSVRVTIAVTTAALGDPVVWRRRPSTGPAYFKTADPRVARADRLRLEFAASAADEPSATLLDRTGKPIAVPVQVSTRDEAGTRWIVADITVAPLAPGDYAIEVKVGPATKTTAFRVVP